MILQDYLKNEVKKTVKLNETMAESGKTDTFKGSEWMGKHHHEYIIWSVESGYGWTGDAINDVKPGESNACVASHVHMIIDGKIMPCGDGHSHELLEPLERKPDIDIGSVNLNPSLEHLYHK